MILALFDQTSKFDLHGEIETKLDYDEFYFYCEIWMKIELKILICRNFSDFERFFLQFTCVSIDMKNYAF